MGIWRRSLPGSFQNKGVVVKKVFLIVLALVVLQSPNASAAADKPCVKSQLNKIVNGAKCQKVGLVYRWVSVSKINPKESPIPTPAPTPTTTVNSTEIAKPVQQMTTFEIIDKKITSYYNNKNNFKLTVIKSPLVDEKKVAEVVSKYETAINYYSFPLNKKITWVFMSETEKEWYVKKSLEIDRYDWTSWWDRGHCNISATAMCSYGNSDTSNPIFYMMIGSRSSWNDDEQMIAEHEAVHMYQMLTFKNGYPSCWVVEGQANALGIGMASRYFNILMARNGQLLEMSKFIPNYQNLSKEQWIDLFKKFNKDNDECVKDGAGYSLGMMAVESLFVNSSAESVDKFIINYSETNNLEQSLNSVLGISLNQFYSNFADHMLNALHGK